jgi:hypothetical protein
MSTERDAWERLITLKVLPPDSIFSPTRAQDGWYSATLKQELERLEQETAKAAPQENLRRKRSTADLLGAIDSECDRLIKDTGTVAPGDRLIHLRQLARDLGLCLRDGDLQRRVWDARRRAAGVVTMIEPGAEVDAPESRWLWEGLLMAGDSNLLVASPKAGKTTLIVAAVAAWHRGEPDYLGQPFHGQCPPVVILGTDMPRAAWMRLLGRFGLAEQLYGNKWRLLPDGPIKGLFTQSEAVYLDPPGLARITEPVAKNPGCLVVGDSYAKLIGPLGLKESDASFAGPLGDLQEVIAPHDATLALIHHAGHARKGEGAVAACRGSTALPAAVSQVISMSWFNRQQNNPDRRVLLETEGRGGEPLQLLIEQQESGWKCHGDAASVLHHRAMEEAEASLTDRQVEVFELVRSRAETGVKTNYRAVREQLKIPDRQALRILRQLEKRGFLTASHEASDTGSSIWFRPA